MVGSLERHNCQNGRVGPIHSAQNNGREIVVADPTVQDLGLVRSGIGCGGAMVGILGVVVAVAAAVAVARRFEVVVVRRGGVVVFFVFIVPRPSANLGVTLSLPPFAAPVCENSNILGVKLNLWTANCICKFYEKSLNF